MREGRSEGGTGLLRRESEGVITRFRSRLNE